MIHNVKQGSKQASKQARIKDDKRLRENHKKKEYQ